MIGVCSPLPNHFMQTLRSSERVVLEFNFSQVVAVCYNYNIMLFVNYTLQESMLEYPNWPLAQVLNIRSNVPRVVSVSIDTKKRLTCCLTSFGQVPNLAMIHHQSTCPAWLQPSLDQRKPAAKMQQGGVEECRILTSKIERVLFALETATEHSGATYNKRVW